MRQGDDGTGGKMSAVPDKEPKQKVASLQDLRDLHETWADRFVQIEEAVAGLAALIRDGDPGLSEDKPRVFHDEFWRCAKCGAKLAVYDPKEDILRVKYKDFLAYFHVGAGGSVTIPCRTCGYSMELHDSRTDGPSGENMVSSKS